MSLFESISVFIKICQLCGLAPFSYSKTTVRWQANPLLGFLTYFLLIIILIISIVATVFNQYFIDSTQHEIAILIFIVMLVTVNIHTSTILLEIIFKRNYHLKFLILLQKLEILFKATHCIKLNYSEIRKMCRRFLCFWFLEIILLVIIQSSSLIRSKDQIGINYTIIYFIPYVLSKLNYVQSVTYVSLLHQNIKALNQYAEHLSRKYEESMKNRFLKKPISFRIEAWDTLRLRTNRVDEPTLRILRQIYCIIWECSIILNDIIYWSMPTGIFNEFALLVFNCYFFIGLLLANGEYSIITMLLVVTWATSTVINILFITLNFKRTNDEVSECVRDTQNESNF